MTTLDPAHVETPDLAKTYAVAEFMLNLLDLTNPPTRKDVEAYVQAHFAQPDGGFRIPVDQDFVELGMRPVHSAQCRPARLTPNSPN